MPRTFTNEPLGHHFRHVVRVEGGAYAMGKSWIDTTSPLDMMDYDHTMPIHEAKALHEQLRLDHLSWQTLPN